MKKGYSTEKMRIVIGIQIIIIVFLMFSILKESGILNGNAEDDYIQSGNEQVVLAGAGSKEEVEKEAEVAAEEKAREEKAKEEAEAKAKEEAEAKAREEAEAKAREEAEAKAKEEAEAKAREEAEAKAKAEAEAKARKEAEATAKAEAEAKAKVEAEEKAKREAAAKKKEREEYILYDSNSRLYSKAELEKLDDTTLQMAINEIYARHGRKFDTKDIREYFEKKSWYRGTIDPKDFDGREKEYFNKFEEGNRQTMVEIRDERTLKKAKPR